jgi:hypothetical protein
LSKKDTRIEEKKKAVKGAVPMTGAAPTAEDLTPQLAPEEKPEPKAETKDGSRGPQGLSRPDEPGLLDEGPGFFLFGAASSPSPSLPGASIGASIGPIVQDLFPPVPPRRLFGGCTGSGAVNPLTPKKASQDPKGSASDVHETVFWSSFPRRRPLERLTAGVCLVSEKVGFICGTAGHRASL